VKSMFRRRRSLYGLMMASLGLVVGRGEGSKVGGGSADSVQPLRVVSVARGMLALAAVSGERAKEVGRRRAASPQSQVRRWGVGGGAGGEGD
jgi:hypothetical protein